MQGVDDEAVVQDRESARIFSRFSYAKLSAVPEENQDLLYVFLRDNIAKQNTSRALLSDADIRSVSLLMGVVLASDAGMKRDVFEQYIKHTKTKSLQSVTFIDERSSMTPEQQFAFSYDKKYEKSPRLVGVSTTDSNVVHVGQYRVSDDLSFGFIEAEDPAGFYLTVTTYRDAYIFHRDNDFQAITDRNIVVTSICISIPVKDQRGNMYPMNFTVYKNPLNNHWWLHRVQRTVNVTAHNQEPIVY